MPGNTWPKLPRQVAASEPDFREHLKQRRQAGYMINTEQYLWLHLQAEGVAPSGFTVSCRFDLLRAPVA